MNKQILFTFFVLAFCINVFSQDTAKVNAYMRGELSPDSLKYLKWIKKSDDFSYISKNILYKHSQKSKKGREVLSLSELKNATGIKVNVFPKYDWITQDVFIVKAQNILYFVNVKSKNLEKRIELPRDAMKFDIASNGNIAFVADSNLYIIDATKTIRQITDNRALISSGLNAYRNEFGCNKGTFWNKQGTQLAFYEKNDVDLTPYPFINYSTKPATVKWYRYPFAGGDNEIVKIGIVNMEDLEVTYLNLSKGDKYYTGITWHPDGKSIYVNEVARDQKSATLTQYIIESGERRAMFTEKSETYVEPEMPMMIVASRNSEFIWLSRKSGYRHLYLHDISGELLNPLTVGNWEVTDIIGFDGKYENLYFVGTAEGDYLNKYIYKANVISLRVTKLSKVEGVHYGYVNNDGYVLDAMSSLTVPYSLVLLNPKGEVEFKVKESKNPLKGKNAVEVESGTYTAADGKTELPYAIIKPAGFDNSKVYPAVMYVYGGPHIQLVENRWMATRGWIMPYILASNGYVVMVTDTRGGNWRGMEFETSVYKNLGKNETLDLKKAYDKLISNSFVDKSKIGIMGASYGGYMTLSMLCNYPDLFKAGIASYPVTDWSLYEVMYTERYMGKPLENKQGYEQGNILNKAEKLKANTLIISGGMDDVTVNQHAELFVQKCVENNIPISHFQYANGSHGIARSEYGHYLLKLHDFFEKKLK